MRVRERTTCWLVAVAGVFAGCGAGTNYVYAPEGASLTTGGALATSIKIPPEQPKGEVSVQSMGITQIDAERHRGVDAVHVRLTVENNSDDRVWTIDTREQLIEIRGEGRSMPMLVNSDRATFPIVQVARREQRVIDLYYPLPRTIDDADDLPAFDLLWQVNTGQRVVGERTAFGRISTEPPVYSDLYVGWGPHWWYDPFYPRSAFIHHHPIVIRDHRSPIVVRSPRGTYTVRRNRG